jgi:hypothetical protein
VACSCAGRVPASAENAFIKHGRRFFSGKWQIIPNIYMFRIIICLVLAESACSYVGENCHNDDEPLGRPGRPGPAGSGQARLVRPGMAQPDTARPGPDTDRHGPAWPGPARPGLTHDGAAHLTPGPVKQCALEPLTVSPPLLLVITDYSKFNVDIGREGRASLIGGEGRASLAEQATHRPHELWTAFALY